jgi:hypothetical protein
MNPRNVTDLPTRPRRFAWRVRSFWILTAALLLGAPFLAAAAAVAQTCEDRNPAHAAALIDQIRFSCQRDDIPYSADINSLTAVADQEALPALRKIASWPTDKGPGNRCLGWVNMARMALAKMGDESYRATLRMGEASFIADDRALTDLIEFLIAHAKDPSMYHNFGDYGSDARDGLLHEIDIIRRRRLVPDLPLADYSDAGIAQWKSYLQNHKGRQMTFPAYLEVTDPYLQCLARRVDWGFPDAILAIAATGGDAALPILRKFTVPWKPEMMGYAVSAPFNPDWPTIQGNVQVALAQSGDEAMFAQIVAELSGDTPYQSVRKLEYLGGKRSVDALVNSLDLSEDVVQKARMKECAIRECYPDVRVQWRQIWKLQMDGHEIQTELCEAMSFHSCVVGVLGYMVKNPPLPPGAPATPENIQKWKDWWAKNKDHAEFAVKPPQIAE